MSALYRWCVYCLVFLLLYGSCAKPDSSATPIVVPTKDLLMGADVSYLPEIRASGLRLQRGTQTEDMLLTLKNAGVNLIRLRLWKNPSSPTSGLATVKQLTQELRSMGFKSLISVHYSDTWADPAHQAKPAAWQGLNTRQLTDSVYAYTKHIASELRPDYIQIGNEINGGLLWPDGRSTNPITMKSLLSSGIRAVREVAPQTKILIHHAGTNGADAFFAGLSDLDYDIIGISYYPMWHGKDLGVLRQALGALTSKYQKPLLIAETAYPFTLGWNDYTNNVIGLPSQISEEYAPTPQGQRDFLLKLRSIINEVPNGLGFCYWGAEWVSFKGKTATDGSSWENQAFWDFENRSLPVLEAYQKQ